VPAPLPPQEEAQEVLTVTPYLTWWVRAFLLVIVVLLTAVFVTAVWLNPYNQDGTARTGETHLQLGLQPCTFKTATGGLPCPSCGMTTSFSLLMHGDPLNSLKANWVGTLLALYCLVLIPWGLASVVLRRPLFILSLDRALSWSVIGFLLLMLLRWGVLMALVWWERRPF
jgi:hypothetical protein